MDGSSDITIHTSPLDPSTSPGAGKLGVSPKEVGWIEVICGCMFSGKTEELIRRIRRAEIARQKVMIFKPRIDDRYSHDHIVSHNEQSLVSTIVDDAAEILPLSGDAHVVGIDEGQFFSENLVSVCETLANNGKRVIVAGLDQDFRGKPFEPMPQLLAVAEYITKTLAICVVCGNPADRTQRKTLVSRTAPSLPAASDAPSLSRGDAPSLSRGGVEHSTERIVVGAADLYEARCRKCFDPPASS